MNQSRTRHPMIQMILIVLFLLLPITSQAQSPVVYGVFFYSPTCPHCHEVINNHWPSIQAEFGDQLQVLFIDVSRVEGSQIMTRAIDAMNISSTGVPMLIIGSQVLVGSADIPQRAPDLIRTGLSLGGIGYPPIPEIGAIFQRVLPEAQALSIPNTERSLLDDPANIVAITVLLGLVTSIGMMVAIGWDLMQRKPHRSQTVNAVVARLMILAGIFIGLGLAGTLVAGSLDSPIPLLIATIVLFTFGILSVQFVRSPNINQLASWSIPMIVTAGLLVAGYLAYVEITLVDATCGVLGNCQAVQQSSYAYVFGIPVGVIGILGYGIILILWLVNRVKQQPTFAVTLFVMALVGVGFSTYLTFIEPFVIGASCVWCLISAVVMGILLWMTAPAGWDAVLAMQHPQRHTPVRR